MMPMADLFRRMGNNLYQFAFPIYQPLDSIFKSYADRTERALLAKFLSAGCVAVDGGANIGIYSRFLAKCVGSSGAVHSFEPSPDNFARLRAAVQDFPNVAVNQLLLGNRTGESLLYISNALNVDHRAYPTEGESRQGISVRSTRLDDYFESGQRVDLIKLDIQGFELHALEGAERVLQDNSSVKLLLEFWPYGLTQAGKSPEAFVSFLQDRGFAMFLPQSDSLTRCERPFMNPSDPTNYFNIFAERAAT
jgi:FkbM family methyltransferase